MPELRFYLNNKLVNPPRNWKELEFQLNFENESPAASVSTNSFEFTGDEAGAINKWLKGGLSGGVGIFEGMPFRIEVCGSNLKLFDGYLDLSSPDTNFECDKVDASAIESGKIDFLNDRAESFTYAYLASQDAITDNIPAAARIAKSDYIAIPYVVSSIPDYTQVVLTGISMVMLGKEISEAVQTVIDLIAEAIGNANTLAVSLGLDPLPLLGTIVKIIIWLIYIVVMLLAFIFLLKNLFDNLIQADKYKFGIRVKTLFEKAAAFLGYTFSSTILNTAPYKDLVIIPNKQSFITDPNQAPQSMGTNLLVATANAITNNIATIGGTIARKEYNDFNITNATGFFEGTFTDLILGMSDVFNAKISIVGNVLYFERWDYFNNQAVVTIPDIREDGLNFDAPNPSTTNASELASNYFVIYQVDSIDTNTYDRYEGTSHQMILKPNVTVNKKNITLKNLTEKRLIFALAKRKQSLTIVEEAFNLLISAFNTMFNVVTGINNQMVSALNAVSSTVATWLGLSIPAIPTLPTTTLSSLNQRIGYMLLSTDFIGVPKLLQIEESGQIGVVKIGKVAAANKVNTSAQTLALNYHFASWAVAPNNKHNQYLIYRRKKMPLCCEDFVKLKDRNIIKTQAQKLGRLDSLTWNPFDEMAKVDYRTKEKYTNNLKQTFIVDGK